MLTSIPHLEKKFLKEGVGNMNNWLYHCSSNDTECFRTQTSQWELRHTTYNDSHKIPCLSVAHPSQSISETSHPHKDTIIAECIYEV